MLCCVMSNASSASHLLPHLSLNLNHSWDAIVVCGLYINARAVEGCLQVLLLNGLARQRRYWTGSLLLFHRAQYSDEPWKLRKSSAARDMIDQQSPTHIRNAGATSDAFSQAFMLHCISECYQSSDGP